MKPVMSRIKFWQMIGRGTRRVDTRADAKPWLPAGQKPVFRILDFWSVFEYFQIKPEGVSPSTSTPAPVRLFRALIQAARVAADHDETDAHQNFVSELREMISGLPTETAAIREQHRLITTVTRDIYWSSMDTTKWQTQSLQVAPLMAYLPGIDLNAVAFAVKCLDGFAAVLEGDTNKADDAAASLVDNLAHLPPDHPDLAFARDEIIRYQTGQSAPPTSATDFLQLRATFTDLMKYRETDPQNLITLDLRDALHIHGRITVGPNGTEYDASDYRSQVEQHIRSLAESHPSMLKLATGMSLNDADIDAIEVALNTPELYITEQSLREAYRTHHGTLLRLIRHALGIEPLDQRETAIRDAFEAYVSAKSYLSADQILFVRTFARRLTEAGRVAEADLYDPPFTQIVLDVAQLLPADDLTDLFGLAADYEVTNSA
jgi:type I restriction enzyme R subunit